MNKQTNRNTTADAATGPSKIEGLTSRQVGDEQAATYTTTGARAEQDAAILERAERILHRRWTRQGTLSSPQDTAAWLRVHCATLVAEVFGVIFLDNRHRILSSRELFRGTIDGCGVSPREVVRAVIEANAAAVVLYHNHPSGNAEPSSADVAITQTLKQALELIGCRVLDHLIAGETVTSLSQRGLC